ncbi:MAG: hypothetical protein HRF46_09200 [Acidobacteriota bacterium]
MTALRSVGERLARLGQVLGVNAVPVAGFFGAGWSQASALAVYWVEGALSIAFVAARIALHRRWTRKVGHYRRATFEHQKGEPGAVGSGSLLGSYLSVAIPFTAVHGLFLAIILFLFLPQKYPDAARLSLADVEKGAFGVLVFLVLGFLVDLVGLRQRTFRSIELATERAMGRIFIVHLTILIGVAASVYFEGPAAFFAVFAGLKLLFDLGGLLPQRDREAAPPAWARWLDRLPAPDGETFSERWRKGQEAAAALRAENELVWAPPAGAWEQTSQ